MNMLQGIRVKMMTGIHLVRFRALLTPILRRSTDDDSGTSSSEEELRRRRLAVKPLVLADPNAAGGLR